MWRRRKKTKGKIEWEKAPDIHLRIDHLIKVLNLTWANSEEIYCFRSTNTNNRAIARIWGFNKIWQIALNRKGAYCLEVISERFDKLSNSKKDEVLLHELAHIPKNFSGALLPHTKKGKGSFHDKLEGMIAAYKKNK